MRLLGRVKGEKEAFTFHAFLQKEGIGGSFEPAEAEDTFNIWIMNEDEVEQARHWFEEFKKNSEDSRFDVKVHPIDREGIAKGSDTKPKGIAVPRLQRPRPAHAPMTRLIILICALLYFWNGYQLAGLAKEKSGARFFNLTPLFINLCYDVPATFPLLVKYFQEHPLENPKGLENLEKNDPEYKMIEETPNWVGFYNIILEWPKKSKDIDAPMFIKLRQGEVWRLITPCLLHGGFLHILFNMLWLWLLGRQIEERIKLWQYLLITLIIGIVSNTAQYLMSGPLFIGYSGIITGLAGFIWMRQRQAPWEGYPLNRGTLIFLMVFIFGMLALQVISFILMRTGAVEFPMNIANTAHITGAIVGALLGRIPFFARGKL